MPAYLLRSEVQQESTEQLLAQLESELAECGHVNPTGLNHLKAFMVECGIWHISELDYTLREEYERQLRMEYVDSTCRRYLLAYDRVKQHSIKKNFQVISRGRTVYPPYENTLLYLPYHPNPKIAKRFEISVKKEELRWDFTLAAPERMKRQMYSILHYAIETETDNDRFRKCLVMLQLLYSACVKTQTEDIEGLELDQVQRLMQTLSARRLCGKLNKAIEYSRRALFMKAEEINWKADVWYLERMHIQPERMNPSNPVKRISFLEVRNKTNRDLLKQYMKYGFGITNLTIGNLRAEMNYIRRFLMGVDGYEIGDVRELSPSQIDRYLKDMQERKPKPATYNRFVMSILHFYQFLQARRYIERIPFCEDYYIKKEIPQHHDRSVDADVAAEIFEKLAMFPEEIRLMYLHLWGVGLRISEICTLKGDAYYIQGRDAWIQVYQTKMKRYKRIPIPDALYKLMRVYIRKHRIREKDYVFQNHEGGPYNSGTFRYNMKRYCRIADIQNGDYRFQAHDYRHTLASYFYSNGVSLQGVRDYLGHTYEEMTRQYIDFMPKKV